MKNIKLSFLGFVVCVLIGSVYPSDRVSSEEVADIVLSAREIKALKEELKKLKAKLKKANYTGSSWERYCEIQRILESVGETKSSRSASESSVFLEEAE